MRTVKFNKKKEIKKILNNEATIELTSNEFAIVNPFSQEYNIYNQTELAGLADDNGVIDVDDIVKIIADHELPALDIITVCLSWNMYIMIDRDDICIINNVTSDEANKIKSRVGPASDMFNCLLLIDDDGMETLVNYSAETILLSYKIFSGQSIDLRIADMNFGLVYTVHNDCIRPENVDVEVYESAEEYAQLCIDEDFEQFDKESKEELYQLIIQYTEHLF